MSDSETTTNQETATAPATPEAQAPAPTPPPSEPAPVPYQVFKDTNEAAKRAQERITELEGQLGTMVAKDAHETAVAAARKEADTKTALADGHVAPNYREYMLSRYQGLENPPPLTEWLDGLRTEESAFFTSPTNGETTTETTPAPAPATSSPEHSTVTTPTAPGTPITEQQVAEWRKAGLWEQKRHLVFPDVDAPKR